MGLTNLQAFNPPLVHSIDVACPPWAPRQLGRLMAVARGDGHVTVYDADHVDRAPNPLKKSKVALGNYPVWCICNASGFPNMLLLGSECMAGRYEVTRCLERP